MRRSAWLVVGAVLWLGAPNAMGAAPVNGGRYQGASKLPNGDPVSIDLTLANDGGEFSAQSVVAVELTCGSSFSGQEAAFLDGSFRPPFRAVQIRRDGHFAARSHGIGNMQVTGRFQEGGRLVKGTVALQEKAPCPDVRTAFSARLVGRPNARRPGRHTLCDRVTIRYPRGLSGDEAYTVDDQGVGCTTARAVARRWDASKRCHRLSTGSSCTVRGAVCTAVRGGHFRRLASARCVTPGRADSYLELIHYQPCKQPSSEARYVNTWAINTRCRAATAYPIDDLFPDEESGRGPCGGELFDLQGLVRCTAVAGYTCILRTAYFGPDIGFRAQCTDDTDPFRALVFEYST